MFILISAQNHLMVITMSKLAPEQPVKKITEEKLDRDDEIIVNYLKVSYYLAKREMPKEEFQHFIDLVADLGMETIDDSSLTYTRVSSVTDFQSAYANVVLENVISEISSADVFLLMADESTDRATQK